MGLLGWSILTTPRRMKKLHWACLDGEETDCISQCQQYVERHLQLTCGLNRTGAPSSLASRPAMSDKPRFAGGTCFSAPLPQGNGSVVILRERHPGAKVLAALQQPAKAHTLGRACDMCRTHCRSEGHFLDKLLDS